jgi:hypothetical protein
MLCVWQNPGKGLTKTQENPGKLGWDGWQLWCCGKLGWDVWCCIAMFQYYERVLQPETIEVGTGLEHFG